MTPSPKKPSEIVEDAVRVTSAVFEGFTRTPVHPEIKDEFRLIIREALISLLLEAKGRGMMMTLEDDRNQDFNNGAEYSQRKFFEIIEALVEEVKQS